MYDPPAGESGHIALVAVQVGDNEWRACWTESPTRVDETAAYLKKTYA